MKAEVNMNNGATFELDEFEYNRMTGKVLHQVNGAHTVVHVTDIGGVEYTFPFGSVSFVRVIREESVEPDKIEEPDNAGASTHLTIEELKDFLAGTSDADAVQALLDKEKASKSPRSTALKLLEEKVKELSGV